jgi:hypothetical protein
VGQPSSDEVRLAIEDLDRDISFWFASSAVISHAHTAAKGLGLGGFELGRFAVDMGLQARYAEILQYVEDRLAEGVEATETLAQALRAALLELDGTDQESAREIRRTTPGR